MDAPRHYVPTGGGDPKLRRHIMWTLGSAMRVWRTMGDAHTLAERCGITPRRARAWLAPSVCLHTPHAEARAVVREADRLAGLAYPHPDGPVDFQAMLRYLLSKGFTRGQIARHAKVRYGAVQLWTSSLRSPSWLSGELLLWTWRDYLMGDWHPNGPPQPLVLCIPSLPEPAR